MAVFNSLPVHRSTLIQSACCARFLGKRGVGAIAFVFTHDGKGIAKPPWLRKRDVRQRSLQQSRGLR
jgi:hypothetical protein